jgi:SAM-dependent methyltransferase
MQDTVYNPQVFDVANLQHAKQIILTPEGGSTVERWAKETPYLVNWIVENAPWLAPNHVVLDYGCGVGRIAKGLIEKTGCRVVGVDISASMRALAHAYVEHPNFLSCDPSMLPYLNVKFSAGYAVWVLQHCEKPQEDIKLINENMGFNAPFFLVNNIHRAVPANVIKTKEYRWLSDGLDIDQLVCEGGFIGEERSVLAPEVCPPGLSENTFKRVYRTV